MSLVVAAVVGALTFAAALVIMTTRRRTALARRLGHFVEPTKRDRSHHQISRGGPIVDRLDVVLVALGMKRRIQALLDRAGIDGGAAAFCGLILLVGGAVFVMTILISGVGLAFALGLGTPAFATASVIAVGQRRVRAFEAQLPEILDTLSASLRAGHGFDHALQNLADDVAEPAAREFKRVIAEVHLGRTLEAALADLGERISSKDLLFVLDAITIQRQVGGSMAELFELVARTVRERDKFRRNLRAITGLPRMSARLLTALPIIAAVLLTLINHAYMAPLYTTNAGHVLLGITILMVCVGGVVLRRIGTVTI